MADAKKKSRRGYYYDLSISPYAVKSPYGDLLKFPSQKKLDIFTRDIDKQIKRVDDLIVKHNLTTFVSKDVLDIIRRAVYQSFYDDVIGR